MLFNARRNVWAPMDEYPLANNKSQPLILTAPYLINVDIHSDNEDKGYKNPHKPKAKVHTILIRKTIIKLNSFAIYFN